MRFSDLASYNIRVLSFICSLLIIPIHASFLGQGLEMSRIERTVMTVISNGICRVAVPFFFVVSGFFLALKYRPTLAWYGGALRKRFFSLYIPFVLWNIIYFCLQLVNGKGFDCAGQRILGYDLTIYPSCMQFWFLQTLFIAVILSVVLLPLLRTWSTALLVMGGLLIGSALNDYGLRLSQQLSLINFFYISLGAVLAFNWDSIPLTRLPCVSLWKMPASLLSLSFFIYASHHIGINLASIVLSHLKMPLLAAYCFKIMSGVAVGIGGGLLFRRYLPRIYDLLTGHR